ncbi:MAG: segregation/condensation protein A [Acidobacteria bacterium]|nr:segregation/condensation protein A [Acidobacteriota bacterium]
MTTQVRESHPCRLQLEIFEGPLDLLLHLIKKEEIDIYDIPIARITDQYLEYLANLRGLDLDIEGEFLFMAATLIHIKSRMLLPRPPEDSGLDEDDPRDELVRQLLEYQRFKAVGQFLAERAQLRQASWPRGQIGWDFVEEVPPVPVDLTIYQLATAFFEILKEERVPAVEMTPILYTVEDKLVEIRVLLDERGGFDFTEYFTRLGHRQEMIVAFLALLELMRQAIARVFQDGLFGRIRVVRAD